MRSDLEVIGLSKKKIVVLQRFFLVPPERWRASEFTILQHSNTPLLQPNVDSKEAL